MFNYNPPLSGVTRHLIIINVLMFVGAYALLGEPHWSDDPNLPGYTHLGRLQLAAFLPGSMFFKPYQIATHMFMHGGIAHIAFNMFSLYMFGPMIEAVWGERKFLFYYLSCGFGAYLIYTGVQWWELSQAGIDPTTWNVPMLGASGAIFGVLTAFAYLFPNNIISLIFPPISLKAKYFMPIIAVLELIYGVQRASTGIAHFAHLGGALTGILIILIWHKGRR
jgi:membrane associated rhomboid family serine protease